MELEELKKKRSVYKRKLTMTMNEVSDATVKFTLHELEAKEKVLDLLQEKYGVIQKSINVLVPDEFEEQIDYACEMLENFTRLRLKIADKKKIFPSVSLKTSVQHEKTLNPVSTTASLHFTQLQEGESIVNFIHKELHVGHVGIVKMKSLARNFCYWKNIDKDIESIAKGCKVCCLKQNEAPMERSHSWEPPTKPWQRLHIDFAGPMSGYYYFVIVDAHSKWVDVIPTKTTTSQWCIKQLRNLFCNFGFPEVLVSDNGPQFTSKVFKDFLEGNGVIHKTSAPFHPSTNGQAERYVQTIKKLLNCMHDEKGDVEYKLSQILIQLRKVPNADGKSPYDLMFQREVRTDFHVMFRSEQEERENQGSRNRREPRRKFDVGDRVQVRNYTREGKWKFGRVLRREGRLHYQVELDEGNVWRRHVDQIRSTCYGGKN
ncbi:uncharacterized protein K02A2.6-like [Diaphorina citri]|uniref:RNA-directed DNA polymerase n=2 Tax=Diaphorina citri TaxID=121845 RepID=A0A1S3DIS1_DIACI|nr:uncharacterized protein K02A2.6-like [Diaphorina citri]